MRPTTPSIALAAIALTVLGGLPSRAAPQGEARTLAQARQLLDEERAEEATRLLQPLAEADPPSAEALFLLSTAHFVRGDADAGREALERSLELDPTLRDAWITLGALDLAEDRYDAALESFERAQALDPSADDNLLNLGATHLLMGDLPSATRSFNAYLASRRSDASAYYLVAKNYALGELWDLAVQHLQAAISLDETTRRLARADPVFAGASDYAPYLTLLATDSFRPAPGSQQRTEFFSAAYDGGHGVLLRAVLNALQFSGRPFDPNVEVADPWALIWSDVRMKLTNSGDGGGQITFSAPPGSFTEEAWRSEIDELAGAIREQVAVLSMRRQ